MFTTASGYGAVGRAVYRGLKNLGSNPAINNYYRACICCYENLKKNKTIEKLVQDFHCHILL